MATKARKPRTKPAQPSPEVQRLVAATILPGEATVSRFGYSAKDASLVQRCVVQTMAIAVSMNARVCAAQSLRLYRKAGSAGSKLWPGRRITDRKRLKFLHGESVTTPGRKAIEYAADAGDIEEVMEHPGLTLMRQPDPGLTGPEWWHLFFWFREAVAKTFLWKGERHEGAPISLYHLYPQWTRVQPSMTTLIGGYWFGRNTAQEVFYEPQDVMYGRHAVSPQHPLQAYSWPQAMTLEGDYENACAQAEIARWNNGGMPGMVLEGNEKMTDIQFRQTMEWLSANYRGVQKTGLPMLLRMCKVAQMGVKPVDMNFEKGLAAVRDQIFLAAGWTESMWHMGSASLASAKVADPYYMGNTIEPRLTGAADEFNQNLLPEFDIEDGEYWLAWDCPVAEDRAALVDENIKLSNAGIITTKRAAAALDIDEDPNQDDVYRFNGVPMVAATPETTDAQATDAAPGSHTDAAVAGAVQQEALNGIQITSLVDLAVQAGAKELPVDTALAIAKISFPLVTDEQLAAVFDPLKNFEPPKPEPVLPGNGLGGGGGNDPPGGGGKPAAGPGKGAKGACILPPPLPELSAKDLDLPHQPNEVTRAMDAMQGQLQSWYQRAYAGSISERGSINVEPFMAELQAIMAEHLPAITEAGQRDVAGDLGGEVIPNAEAVEWARAQGAKLVTQVSDSMKDALARRVADGLAEGRTTTQIQHAIREEAPEFGATRAEVIARTETAGAANHGAIAQMKAVGIEYKDFIVGRCPKCLAIKAKYPVGIPIDAQWVDSEGNAFDSPPFHPQCICTVTNSTKPKEPDATP